MTETTAAASTALGLPSGSPTEASLPAHELARAELARFDERLKEGFWALEPDLADTLRRHLGEEFEAVDAELREHGERLAGVDALVSENDARVNFPRLDSYDGIGRRVDEIRHHGAYAEVGDAIYGSRVVERLVRRGGLREGLAFHFLDCMLGEAGHNCPVICNFETARLLEDRPDLEWAEGWLEGLLEPSYRGNLTASQFLTEVTGGSDVGANATVAWQDTDGNWRIRGEKWFTSNADADLTVITARHAAERPGTKGLSVFLVPRRLPSGELNAYTLRRLKEKFGTRALATAEIDYHDAWAVPLSTDVDRGFNVMMERVVHHSRIALAVSCVAMAARAYAVARAYADERTVFGCHIVGHVLARENLAGIRAHVLAMQAGLWALIAMQDEADLGVDERPERRAFIRLMANAYKQVTSKACVDHCHHALDTLGGNGTIETFSPIPRLLRDAVIEENWEGTHNTVRAQVLRDMLRYEVDAAWVAVMREEAAKLPDAQQACELADLVAAAERDAADLREDELDGQQLRMTALVNDMVNVAAYCALLAEAGDENADGRGAVKRAAARLFRSGWIDGERRHDADARATIDAVIEFGRR
jgi:acyl-CoA dehydrogenase